MKCKNPPCGATVPGHLRNCPACGWDNGAPNVRAAEATAERDALYAHVRDAEAAAANRGCETVLSAFASAVENSAAVYCCHLGEISRVASSDQQPFRTFQAMVKAEALIPDDSFYDRWRPVVEAVLFPHYNEDMHFAALSLTDRGPIGYGDFSVTFKERGASHFQWRD
jgi:hypothetical protein